MKKSDIEFILKMLEKSSAAHSIAAVDSEGAELGAKMFNRGYANGYRAAVESLKNMLEVVE